MEISEESLRNFKQLWKEVYDEDIDDDFAQETVTQLLGLLKAVYETKSDHEL